MPNVSHFGKRVYAPRGCCPNHSVTDGRSLACCSMYGPDRSSVGETKTATLNVADIEITPVRGSVEGQEEFCTAGSRTSFECIPATPSRGHTKRTEELRQPGGPGEGISRSKMCSPFYLRLLLDKNGGR